MDILIYLLFGGILFFYVVYFVFRNKLSVKNHIFQFFRKLHYWAIGLIIFNLILNFFDYEFRGLWTEKIIMWIFLITTFVIQLKVELLKTSLEKIYFKILLFLPSLLLVSWIVPMFGAYLCYSFILLFNTYNDQVVYNDKDYILKFEEGFLKHEYELDVFRKIFIFEHKVKSVILNDMNFDKIVLVREQDNLLKIEFKEYDTQKIKDTLINLKS